jgi:signal transduction histidine kinase
METTLTRILLVEDNPEDAQLVRRKLARELARCDWFQLDHVSCLQQAIDVIGKRNHDVALLDLHLPDSDGVDTVRRVRESDPGLPIVVFTVAGDDELAVAALRAGAQDYLVKDELGVGPVLHRAICYAIERMRIAEERRRLQERLHHAEKLQSLGVLAAGTAFGFNTLLGDLLERADQGLTEEGDVLALKECLRDVRSTALRAARVASQLRDYALSESGKTAPLDLSSIVANLSESLEAIAGPGAHVHYTLAADLPRIRVDAFELRQLLVNLVLNASEALDGARGSICIETGCQRLEAGLLADTQGASGLLPGRYVVLRVADSGHGIRDSQRERLFDPFYTTKYAGRGLGLSAVFGIARRHGAAIHVGERIEGGTVFTVLFPPLDD